MTTVGRNTVGRATVGRASVGRATVGRASARGIAVVAGAALLVIGAATLAGTTAQAAPSAPTAGVSTTSRQPAQSSSVTPSKYSAARKAWIKGSKVSAAETNRYLDRAARDLHAARRNYATQERQLHALAAIPVTDTTHQQRTRAHRLVTALDSFFHTPGLYR